MQKEECTRLGGGTRGSGLLPFSLGLLMMMMGRRRRKSQLGFCLALSQAFYMQSLAEDLLMTGTQDTLAVTSFSKCLDGGITFHSLQMRKLSRKSYIPCPDGARIAIQAPIQGSHSSPVLWWALLPFSTPCGFSPWMLWVVPAFLGLGPRVIPLPHCAPCILRGRHDGLCL